MRNEANREACEAAAIRGCETKPIRCETVRDWADMMGAGAEQSQTGGVRGEGNQDAKRSQSAGGRAHAGTIVGEALTNAWAGAEQSQSHFRTVRQSGNPSLFSV